MADLFATQTEDGKLHLVLAKDRATARNITLQEHGQPAVAVWELTAKRVW